MSIKAKVDYIQSLFIKYLEYYPVEIEISRYNYEDKFCRFEANITFKPLVSQILLYKRLNIPMGKYFKFTLN